MNELHTLAFGQSDLSARLQKMDASELNTLEFGVIGFDADTHVSHYNSHESKMTALSPQRVLGKPLFTDVAICMNNFLVAQRFEDAAAEGSALDATIDFVLTLRMRPIKVKLRLLAEPGATVRYVLVLRPS